jgi:hypothetical protein
MFVQSPETRDRYVHIAGVFCVSFSMSAVEGLLSITGPRCLGPTIVFCAEMIFFAWGCSIFFFPRLRVEKAHCSSVIRECCYRKFFFTIAVIFILSLVFVVRIANPTRKELKVHSIGTGIHFANGICTGTVE